MAADWKAGTEGRSDAGKGVGGEAARFEREGLGDRGFGAGGLGGVVQAGPDAVADGALRDLSALSIQHEQTGDRQRGQGAGAAVAIDELDFHGVGGKKFHDGPHVTDVDISVLGGTDNNDQVEQVWISIAHRVSFHIHIKWVTEVLHSYLSESRGRGRWGGRLASGP